MEFFIIPNKIDRHNSEKANKSKVLVLATQGNWTKEAVVNDWF
jgi:hypothetical protein